MESRDFSLIDEQEDSMEKKCLKQAPALTVNKETLRVLTQPDLKAVQGGFVPTLKTVCTTCQPF